MPHSRTLACAATVVAMACGLTGCKYAAALAKQEWVVIFKPGATQAQHRLVLASCSDIANVVPEPMGDGKLVAELDSNVRFRVDKATQANLAQLSVCFGKFSFVQSYDTTDPSQ